MSFGKLIKRLRIRHNLSQDQLAHRAGLIRQNVSRIESGQHSPTEATVSRCLAGMGMTLSDLIREEYLLDPAAAIAAGEEARKEEEEAANEVEG